MDYNQNWSKSAIEELGCADVARDEQRCTTDEFVGTPLTNYKEFVDIDNNKIVHYGLSKNDFDYEVEKQKKQKQFLDYTFLFDRINKNYIPLSDVIISAKHSPHRFYGEILNRTNTLIKVANQRGLKAIFMTLTLPSEYHQYKTIKRGKYKGQLKLNPKYNGVNAKDSIKELTKMFSKLRHDRSLKELTSKERMFFRVNEPHKDGTPHTHILLFVPSDRIERVKSAYKRLYDERANDIQVITDDINDSVAYVMKYINKTLPLSKKEKLSEKELYLQAWYSKNKVVRFNSSRTLAPLSIYRLLHNRYSLYALTKLIGENHFKIYVTLDTKKVMEIVDDWGDVVYIRNENFDIQRMGNNLQNYSQPFQSVA